MDGEAAADRPRTMRCRPRAGTGGRADPSDPADGKGIDTSGQMVLDGPLIDRLHMYAHRRWVLGAMKCLVGIHLWHRVDAEGVEMIECYRCRKREPRLVRRFTNPSE
jgi:hypothetical protein